ncbi:MAG: 16S rRNA (guanine(527)-N(7))-methyltransferase RsmG [Anaerolineaceae bacterium]|nr:16S rRNA (guanine(527)-N(7))-methyltransferase RsmG [Anaerolineaceae bacterium]
MDKLRREVQKLFGIRLTARQMAAFELYEQELTEWNSRFNLTAIRDSDSIRCKHFLDSLSCAVAWKDKPPGRLVDIGTGAGFPGIPLKIIYPGMSLLLVDSVGKKTDFCRHLVDKLELDRVEVVQGRAEDIGRLAIHREQFDWAVARAVATLPILVEYLLPLVRIGGSILAQKGEHGPAEAHTAEKAVHMLGGRLRQLHKIELPSVVEDRYLIIIDKIAATPPQYPRRAGIPSKKPLDLAPV